MMLAYIKEKLPLLVLVTLFYLVDALINVLGINILININQSGALAEYLTFCLLVIIKTIFIATIKVISNWIAYDYEKKLHILLIEKGRIDTSYHFSDIPIYSEELKTWLVFPSTILPIGYYSYILISNNYIPYIISVVFWICILPYIKRERIIGIKKLFIFRSRKKRLLNTALSGLSGKRKTQQYADSKWALQKHDKLSAAKISLIFLVLGFLPVMVSSNINFQYILVISLLIERIATLIEAVEDIVTSKATRQKHF